MKLADGYVPLKHKRLLCHVLANTPTPARLTAMSKDISLYWDTRLENALEIALICVDSWRGANSNWTIHLLDHAIVDHRADVLRTPPLQCRSGVWADITTFCHRPLSDWLLFVMVLTDFVAFARPGGNRLIANLFMAAQLKTQLIKAYAVCTMVYWKERWYLPQAYFWHHYLFEMMLLSSPALRRTWTDMLAQSSTGPHLLQGVWSGGLVPGLKVISSFRQVPVHKLTNKRGAAPEDVLAHLSKTKS